MSNEPEKDLAADFTKQQTSPAKPHALLEVAVGPVLPTHPPTPECYCPANACFVPTKTPLPDLPPCKQPGEPGGREPAGNTAEMDAGLPKTQISICLWCFLFVSLFIFIK